MFNTMDSDSFEIVIVYHFCRVEEIEPKKEDFLSIILEEIWKMNEMIKKSTKTLKK